MIDSQRRWRQILKRSLSASWLVILAVAVILGGFSFWGGNWIWHQRHSTGHEWGQTRFILASQPSLLNAQRLKEFNLKLKELAEKYKTPLTFIIVQDESDHSALKAQHQLPEPAENEIRFIFYGQTKDGRTIWGIKAAELGTRLDLQNPKQWRAYHALMMDQRDQAIQEIIHQFQALHDDQTS